MAGIERKEVTVIGAGLVGSMAALVLAKNQDWVKIIDPEFKNKRDQKKDMPISLWAKQKDLMEKVGLWELIEDDVVPMQRLKLTYVCEGRLETIEYHGDKDKDQTLGWSISAKKLKKALHACLKENKRIETIADKVIDTKKIGKSYVLTLAEEQEVVKTDRLLIADGLYSKSAEQLGIDPVRITGQKWVSIVSALEIEGGELFDAEQYFCGKIIYGLVPHERKDRIWVIQTMLDDESNDLKQMSEHAHCEKIAADFGWDDKKLKLIQERLIIASELYHREISNDQGVLCIGQARFQLPPVGSQGLNRMWHQIEKINTAYEAWDDKLEQLWRYDEMKWWDQWVLFYRYYPGKSIASQGLRKTFWRYLKANHKNWLTNFIS